MRSQCALSQPLNWSIFHCGAHVCSFHGLSIVFFGKYFYIMPLHKLIVILKGWSTGEMIDIGFYSSIFVQKKGYGVNRCYLSYINKILDLSHAWHCWLIIHIYIYSRLVKHSAAISSRAISPNIRLHLQELLQDTRWRQQTNENKASRK